MSTDAEFIEKLRSLHVARPSRRGAKVTVDVHDEHKVKTTEHWNDQVDVHVKVGTVKVKSDESVAAPLRALTKKEG